MAHESSDPPLLRHGKDPILRDLERRALLRYAAAGTVITAFGGALWLLAHDERTAAAREQKLADGRPRLPPGQRVLEKLRPMGGEPGDPTAARFRLFVHGAVKHPFWLDFNELLALPQVTRSADVHCVTGWSVLDARWHGVTLASLAARAQVLPAARHVIFEAAHGYTANVPLREALAPDVLVAHRLNDEPLHHRHGGPVRAVVPQLYFWKSAKWLRGIRFVEEDAPGFWEVRGYHNHGDPWREQRYG